MAKKVTEPIFKEIIAENSPNVGRKMDIQISWGPMFSKGWIWKRLH